MMQKYYFTKIFEDDLKVIIKPRYVNQIPKALFMCIMIISKYNVR